MAIVLLTYWLWVGRSEGYVCVGRKIWYSALMDIDVVLNLHVNVISNNSNAQLSFVKCIPAGTFLWPLSRGLCRFQVAPF